MLSDYQLLSFAPLPANNIVTRQQLYTGNIFLTPPNPFGEAFVDKVCERIADTLALTSFERCRAVAYNPHARLASVRAWLKHGAPELRDLLQGMLGTMGFTPDSCAIDYPRLRVIPPATLIPAGKSIYDIHRDTWFGNAETQINAWLPLHDITAHESFAIYPDWFGKAVRNNSAGFDYDHWQAHVGWQTTQPTHADAYPHALESLDTETAFIVTAPKASCLLFSAQHLHGTVPNRSHLVRYSIDFRFVHRADYSSRLGPRNIDNVSRGSSLTDYRYLQPVAA